MSLPEEAQTAQRIGTDELAAADHGCPAGPPRSGGSRVWQESGLLTARRRPNTPARPAPPHAGHEPALLVATANQLANSSSSVVRMVRICQTGKWLAGVVLMLLTTVGGKKLEVYPVHVPFNTWASWCDVKLSTDI